MLGHLSTGIGGMITATAHKLARLIHNMLTKDEEYTDQGQDYYEIRYRASVMHNLARREIRKLRVSYEAAWVLACPGSHCRAAATTVLTSVSSA